MAGLGHMQVLGPFPGSEATGELLGVMVEDNPKELLPIHLIPVRESISANADLKEQARRAAAAAANLKHPNIPRTFGIEEIQGKAMQVKAWIEAFPLRAIVQEGGRLPPQFAARILVDVCRATQHALDRGGEGGRVPGALSLDTVLVATSGVTQVVGFGVPMRSTPTIESDVHALGSLLHALLSGDLPFADPTGEGAAVPTRPPALSQLGITGPLAEIASQALSEEALTHFRSPGALAEAIGRVSGDLIQPAAVATYLDLVFPPEEGDRAARRTAIATALAKHQMATIEKARAERKLPQERSVEPAPKLLQEPGVPAVEKTPVGNLPSALVDLVSTTEIALDAALLTEGEKAAALPAATAAPVETQSPEVQPPPADRSVGKQPSTVVDLVSTTDIVLDSTHAQAANAAAAPSVPPATIVETKPPEVPPPPAARPAESHPNAAVDLVSTAEIILDSTHAQAAPSVPPATIVETKPPEVPPPPAARPAESHPNAAVDLVSTAEIILDSTHAQAAPSVPPATIVETKPPKVPPPPAARPAESHPNAAVDLVSTAEIILEPPPSPAPPDLVSTADIVAEPPQVPRKPDQVGAADIVAEPDQPSAPPDLVSTADIVPEMVRPLPPWPSRATAFDQSQVTPPVAQPRILPAEVPAPIPIRRRPEVLLASVIISCLVLGFCLSYFLGFGVPVSASAVEPGAAKATEVVAAQPPAAPLPAAVRPPPVMLSLSQLREPSLPPQSRELSPSPQPIAEARSSPGRPKLSVSAEPAGNIFIDGKLAGRSPLAKSVSKGSHKVRLYDSEQGIDVTRTVEAKGSETRVRFTVGKGRLTVIAPEGAAIFVDNRRVGTTEIRDLSVWEGEHRLLVTLGQARETHVFQLQAGGNYMYEVTKTAGQ